MVLWNISIILIHSSVYLNIFSWWKCINNTPLCKTFWTSFSSQLLLRKIHGITTQYTCTLTYSVINNIINDVVCPLLGKDSSHALAYFSSSVTVPKQVAAFTSWNPLPTSFHLLSACSFISQHFAVKPHA